MSLANYKSPEAVVTVTDIGLQLKLTFSSETLKALAIEPINI
jgi:hypothetical protein